ncbi:alpha/beta fold hydrolase [Pseudoroseomonas ludipueritiae]|uniref:Alpha/beta hydrolase n=1 Tax=Pseudoroseomonas ludipueritiae TaxID=198093 RepID=A0ABR7RBU4_9PROT|nr:alpha/beta hydrolase [Pseudoroseomonas ludipueritiae]MBC9179052.1 alpha/beta hydrolase [Pseudoroseomonas ludipueritiae]
MPIFPSPAPSPPPATRTGALLLGAAVALGAMALFNHAASRAAERRHPPRGRFLRVEGLDLHYLEQGDPGAPVVVLVHGNGAMAEDFAASGLMDRLAARHRVIAFDRPGFGYTPRPRGRVWSADAQAELLLAALRQLGIAKPVLVGHSWGVLVALAMALRGGAGALVLLGGYALPQPRPDVLPPSLLALPLLGDLLSHTVAPLLNRPLLPALLRRLFAPRHITQGFRIGFPTELVLRPGSLRASGGDTALMIPSAAALSPHYGGLDLPVTIMAGTGDRIVDTARQSAALHRRLPRSRFLPLEDAGHMIHHTHTGAVAEAVESAAAPPPPG